MAYVVKSHHPVFLLKIIFFLCTSYTKFKLELESKQKTYQ